MATSESKQEKFVKTIDLTASNLSAKWKIFKEQFAIYKVVKGIDAMTTEDEKICHMLVVMGSDAVPVYNQFVFDQSVAAKKKTLANVIKFFDEYFEPVKNVIYERLVFNQMVQDSSESIHAFVVRLQTQSENCEYGVMKPELVRDRIVVGVRDSELRKYLIDTENLTLELCIQKAKQFISHQSQAEKMGENKASNKEESNNIDTLSTDKRRQWQQKNDLELKSQCQKCGKWRHFGGKCPAENSKCNKCKKIGHWAKVCKSLRRFQADKKVAEVQEREDEILDSLYLGSH
jgi:hypothetical protein